jgi:hypothetical protein
MKVGDKIRSSTNKTWKGVILKKTIWGYLIRWETGPLAGKNANVLSSYLVKDNEKVR